MTENAKGNRRLKSVIVFFISVVISLPLSWGYEHLKEPEQVEHALELQRSMTQAVESFRPLDLGARFIDALDLRLSHRRSIQPAPTYTEDGAEVPHLKYWATRHAIGAVFWPFVAIADVFWNSFPRSSAAFLALALQILLGAAITIWGVYKMTKGERVGIGAARFILMLMPIAAVAVGSLLSIPLWLIMWVGVFAVGKFFAFAATCFACSFYVGAAYIFGVKSMEIYLHKFGEEVISKVIR